MKTKSRFPLAHLPTPIEPMSRLSEALGGPELWIKRDDQTGLAAGGNKTRKLEVLIADALHLGADVVLAAHRGVVAFGDGQERRRRRDDVRPTRRRPGSPAPPLNHAQRQG